MLLATSGVMGVIILVVVVGCCGGMTTLYVVGKQARDEAKAREAPYREKLKGDWVAYAIVREVDGKKKKRAVRKPELGLQITDETLRYVKEGAPPEAFTFTFYDLDKKRVRLGLSGAPASVADTWEIRLRKGELRVATEAHELALRRDPKALKKLIARQDAAWAAEEEQLKAAKQVDAAELCEVFVKDEARGLEIYKDRTLEVSGEVTEASFSFDAEAQFTLAGCERGVDLLFPGRRGRESTEAVYAGDAITARCRLDNALDKPELKDCALLEVNGGAPPAEEPRPPVRVSADALCGAYVKDSERGDERYLHRQLEVTGTIKEVTHGIIIGYQLTLKARGCFNGVFVNFERDETREAALARSYRAGQRVTVSCFWPGQTLGLMHLADCEPTPDAEEGAP